MGSPDTNGMLTVACAFADAGFAVHWLHERSKRPIGNDWPDRPVATADSLRATYRPGNNVGFRLGEPSKVGDLFVQVIDLDVRVHATAGEALAKLRELLPAVDSLPFVVSGSGGASRHFYFLTERPFRSKKLAHSGQKFTDAAGKQHWTWEIELFGTGKQVAAPPSIHPDTGNPYVWGREFDFDLLEMGLGPIVSADQVAQWGPGEVANPAAEDDDDLLAYTRAQPMGLSEAEIQAVLADLPLADFCDDRDGWLQVGMALHHEFEGRDEGLEVWNAFSAQSEKYDEADQARVWRSFRGRPSPVRMASLVKAAAVARMDDGFDDDEPIEAEEPEDDGIADLLGEAPAPSQPGEAKKSTFDPEWKSKLDIAVTDKGAVTRPTLHNIELIVANDPRTRGVPQLNLFTQEVVQRGTPGTRTLAKPGPKPVKQLVGDTWRVRDPINGDLWDDFRDNSIRSVLEAPERQGGYAMKITDRDLRAAVEASAKANRFHPITEYLDGLVWDGKERVESLFIDYLGAPNTAYTRSVARCFLIAAVARVFMPGHKFDFTPILEGLQGKRKTTFIEILAKHWFAELDGDFHDTKQMIETMQGAWMLEIPELSGFGRADVRVIKAFISRRIDKARLSYARRATLFARQCVFMGSTNDRRYLRDDTGGRRFWPVPCAVNQIDTDRLRANVDQIWAEAKAMHDEMRARQPHGDLPLFLTDAAAEAESKMLQESRRFETGEDALAGRIEEWLEQPVLDDHGFDDDDLLGGQPTLREKTCLIEIWTECMGNNRSAYDSRQSQILAMAMQKIGGWESDGTQHRFDKYGKQRAYVRVGSPESKRVFLDSLTD